MLSLGKRRHFVKKFLALLAIGSAWFAYAYFHRPITYPPGVLISSDPAQTAIMQKPEPIEHGRFQLKPLAHFSIEARVLHRKVYGYDRQSALVPVDLALGWGPMSDQSILDRLEITQSMRFYWYEYRLPPPLPPEQIVLHSTNLHVIPATKTIGAICKSLRVGDLVHLDGELVEATGAEIGTWRSSLSRTDTGNGACELMLVEECEKLSAVPERPNALVRR